MSCQDCHRLPENAFGRKGIAIRTFKIIENSKVRVIYADASPIQLLISRVEPPKDRTETSYFPLESGEKELALIDNTKNVMVKDNFLFKPNTIYTIIVFYNHILQFEEENIVCPFPGYVRLQVYNMDRGKLNMETNGKLIFEGLGNNMFMETVLKTGVHDILWEEENTPLIAEIELRNSNIYTLFLLKEFIFLVENAYCVNLV